MTAVAQLLGGVTGYLGCRSGGRRRRRGHEGARVQGTGRGILRSLGIDGDGRRRTRTDLRLSTYDGRLKLMVLLLLLRGQRRRYEGGTKDRTRSEIRGDVNFKMRYERRVRFAFAALDSRFDLSC